MKAARIDRNHVEIVAALRKAGAFVFSLAGVGKGVPDLLIGYCGKTALIEIKDGAKPPSARRLTPDQLAWHGSWLGGTLAVVDSVDAALRVLAVMRAGEVTA